MEQKYLFVLTRSGLNDVLSQIHRGINLADSLGMVPVVCLEAHPHYRIPFGKLFVLEQTNVTDHTEVEKEWPATPSLEKLIQINDNSKHPRNQVISVSGYNLYLGKGGGVRHSVNLILQFEHTEFINRLVQKKLAETDLESCAIHLRGMDVFTRESDLRAARKLIRKRKCTVYSDCDVHELLGDGPYDLGSGSIETPPKRNDNFHPLTQREIDQRDSARSIEDFVSLLVMSHHKDILLLQFSENRNDSVFFGFRFSGFGILSLSLALSREAKRSPLFLIRRGLLLTRLIIQGPRQLWMMLVEVHLASRSRRPA